MNFKSNLTKFAVVAGVAILSVGAVVPTMATSNPVAYKIADALGIKQDLTDYKNIIGEKSN